MKRISYAAVLAMWLVTPAFAQDCPDTTQTGLTVCAAAAFQKADERLNTVYHQVVSRLKSDPAQTKRLTQAENDWLRFRDSECEFISAATLGGSIHPMIVSGCRETLTKARADQLQGYLKCPEGDLACPLPPN